MACFIYYFVEKCTYPMPMPLFVWRLLITRTETIAPIGAKWLRSYCYLMSCDRFPTKTVDYVSLSFYSHGDTLIVSSLNVQPFYFNAQVAASSSQNLTQAFIESAPYTYFFKMRFAFLPILLTQTGTDLNHTFYTLPYFSKCFFKSLCFVDMFTLPIKIVAQGRSCWIMGLGFLPFVILLLVGQFYACLGGRTLGAQTFLVTMLNSYVDWAEVGVWLRFQKSEDSIVEMIIIYRFLIDQ